MNAVSFCIDVEELTSDGDGGWERVLGIVDTLRSCQSAGGEFTCKVSVSIYLNIKKEPRGRTNPSRLSLRGGTPAR